MALPTLLRHSPRARRIRASQPIGTLNAQLDQLFADLWSGLDRPRPLPGPAPFLPRMDLVETDEEIRLSAELPGLKNEDFHIEFEDGVLSLRGEKRPDVQPLDPEGKQGVDPSRHRTERSYGRFERKIQIPVEVDADDAKASYRDGVLVITLPKSDSAKIREIPIDPV